MGIFEQFPYTNFHDLNLDWILRAIRSMDKKLDEFVASNVLSYADPIQWDIETQYAKNTVVIDPKTGTAYMSINPVPVGQLLTNKYYWQPIFNYNETITALKKQIAAEDVTETNGIVQKDINVGDWVWYGNILYEATKKIETGGKIIPDSNTSAVTVEDAIKNINNKITSETAARESADTDLNNKITSETAARESADTDLENKIKSLGVSIRTVVFVGDSYGIGTGATLETGLAYKIAEKLNKTVGTDFFNYSQGGIGFGTETSFKTMIDNNTAPSPENVTTLIIAGGRNDTNLSIDIEMTNCINAAKSKYPNATIYIVFDCSSKDRLEARVSTLYNYAINSYKNGCAFIDVSTLCKTAANCIADLYHPNANGYDLLAGGIVSVITGGNKVELPVQYVPITNDAGLNMYLVATDTTSQIVIQGNITLNETAKSTGNANNYLVQEYNYSVNDRPNTLSSNNQNFIELYGECAFNLNNESTFYPANYRLEFSENKMKVYLTALTAWPAITTGDIIHMYMSASGCSIPGYFL